MAKENRLTGIQKAAILFITLGPDAASGIIKQLPDPDIQKITYEIANISSVKQEQRTEILQEFIEMNKAKDYIIEGGFEYAKNLDRKSTRLNSSHANISYAVFCLKKKK